MNAQIINLRECNICVHSFNCTCPDSQIYHTICKHIHLVAQHDSYTAENKYIEATSTMKGNENLLGALLNEITPNASILFETIKNRILQLTQDIASQIESVTNILQLKEVEKQLLSTKNSLSISAIPTASITVTDQIRKEPANTKIQKQRPFPKTQKKSRPSV